MVAFTSVLGAPAGGLDLDALGAGTTVLSGEGDFDHRHVGAEVTGVGEVTVLAAKDDEVEVADRRIGDDRHGGLQATTGDRRTFSPGDEVDLAVEQEG